MAIPTFAEVVGMATVTLPLVGTAHNIVTEIGTDGVVGVKSGYTSQAMGCMVLAAIGHVGAGRCWCWPRHSGSSRPPRRRPEADRTTARPPSCVPDDRTTPPRPAPPPTTAPTTTTTTVHATTILDDPVPARSTPARWSRSCSTPPSRRSCRSPWPRPVSRWPPPRSPGAGRTHRTRWSPGGAWLLGWPGQQVTTGTKLAVVPSGATAGRRVGAAGFVLGTQIESVPVELGGTLPEPSWWWRLIHD